MKIWPMLIFYFTLVFAQSASCQTENLNQVNSDSNKFYFYWGWNRAGFSNSTITFSGANYDFSLNEVIAKDRQSKFSLKTYFNPAFATIPQYNFRVGYFLKKNWDISFGIDHMKYVVQQGQEVELSGRINNDHPIFDGEYSNDKIQITEDFLAFEHTDGLNYINFELRHANRLFSKGKVETSLKKGFGLGIMFPKTNTTLMGQERYDEFHFSGFGFGGILGLNIKFFDSFFIQTECKGGYISLPNVRTSMSKADIASHNFFFTQVNVVFGTTINVKRKSKIKKKDKEVMPFDGTSQLLESF